MKRFLAFLILMRAVWFLAGQLVATNAATKALACEANVAALANQMTSLTSVFTPTADGSVLVSGHLVMQNGAGIQLNGGTVTP